MPPAGRHTIPASRLRRVEMLVGALVTVVVVAVAAWQQGAVSAHAELVGVDPPAGSLVPATPDEVVITFTETVSLSGGSAQLYDDAGALVPVEATTSGDTVRLDLPARLPDGTYLVAWRVISLDAHPVTGTSPFSIGSPSSNGAADVTVGDDLPAGVAPWRVLATALAYGGALVAVGASWFTRRWRRQDGIDTILQGRLDRLDGIVTVAGIVGIIALLAAVPARLVTVGGGWDALTDDSFVGDTLMGPIGQATVVSVVGLVGLLACYPGRPGRGSSTAGLVFTAAALGGFVLDGHTRTKEPTWLMMTADAVHLAAAAVWLGGITALAVVLRRSTGAARARVVLDVSSAALWSVAAVSVAGVVMSVIVLPTFNALADTGYGLALLVKVALVVVLLALGQRNRLVLVPALAASESGEDPAAAEEAVRRLRASVGVALAVAALLLITTATLVGRSPVVGGTGDGDASSSDGTTGAGDVITIPLSSGAGSVTLQIDPASVGPNVIELMLSDDRGQPLGTVQPPTVELTERSRDVGPLVFEATNQSEAGQFEAGSYTVAVDVPFAGTWEVRVDARTSTFDTGSATTELVIAP